MEKRATRIARVNELLGSVDVDALGPDSLAVSIVDALLAVERASWEVDAMRGGVQRDALVLLTGRMRATLMGLLEGR